MKLTAKRVGLQMPNEYDENNEKWWIGYENVCWKLGMCFFFTFFCLCDFWVFYLWRWYYISLHCDDEEFSFKYVCVCLTYLYRKVDALSNYLIPLFEIWGKEMMVDHETENGEKVDGETDNKMVDCETDHIKNISH